jgi:hypothetical protein
VRNSEPVEEPAPGELMISFQPAQKIKGKPFHRTHGFFVPRELLGCRSTFARPKRSAPRRKT